MATTKELRLCIKCDSELTEDGNCPKCNEKLEPVKFIADFEEPTYIYDQVKTLINDIKQNEKDPHALDQKTSMVREARHFFISNHMSEESMMGAIDDTVGIIRNLHRLKISAEVTRNICENIIKAGKLAESWRSYIAQGGRIHEQTFKTARPGTGEQGESATGRAGTATE